MLIGGGGCHWHVRYPATQRNQSSTLVQTGKEFKLPKLLGSMLSNKLPGRGESWYGITLPNGMISRESQEGTKLLSTCNITADVVDFFCKQQNRTFCGPCSLAMSINALGISDFVADQGSEGSCISHSFEQTDLWEDDIAYNPLLSSQLNDLVNKGLTLMQLENMAKLLGLKTDIYQVAKGDDLSDNGLINIQNNLIQSVDVFRDKLISLLQDPKSSVILNYYKETLGYHDLHGHFSPLGAYHADEDMFLVLDVWPETPPAWIKTLNLFNATATVDGDSQSWRGFLVIKQFLDFNFE